MCVCVQEVSLGAITLFDRGQVQAALETATTLLVPALKSMSDLRCPGDDAVMERVREEWCNCLTHPSLSGSELYCIVCVVCACMCACVCVRVCVFLTFFSPCCR